MLARPRLDRLPAIALAVAAWSSSAQAQEPRLAAGPMVGATTHAEARIWAQGSGPGQLRVTVRAEGAEPITAGPAALDPDRAHTATLLVQGLRPETQYAYEVSLDGEAVPGGPWSFHTLPPPGSGRVRIAFGSCFKLSHRPEQPVFASIAAAKPDAFLWLGDNCYFDDDDVEDPARLWARMSTARAAASLRPLLSGTPNLAQWDDHDYGDNNSDRRFPLKETTRDIFRAFWPNPSYGEGDQGIYCKASLGPVDLFLLDNRWFRDPRRQKDGPEKGILGPRQRTWLLQGLEASKAPIKVVATGGQFLARYHRFESWDKTRFERDGIVESIREAGIGGVLFISGDRHLAEVTRWRGAVGYDLWDVTSSPLANRWWPDGGKLENPEREFVYGDGPNFGWIDVNAEAKRVTVELRDVAGKVIWSKSPDDLWPQADTPRRF
jgi:alkaline phosphatase D